MFENDRPWVLARSATSVRTSPGKYTDTRFAFIVPRASVWFLIYVSIISYNVIQVNTFFDL